MALDLEVVKAHLNVTIEEDDAILSRILLASTAYAERILGYRITDAAEFPTGTPADVEQAILLLAGHLYSNRETTLVGVSAMDLPFGAMDILRNHRRWTFA